MAVSPGVVVCQRWRSALLQVSEPVSVIQTPLNLDVLITNDCSRCNKKLDVPLRAHLVSCVLVAIVGVLYLGSYTAFNSMVTACIVLLYISYSVPVGFLLFHMGRCNLKPGPFWLGKVGMVANVVLLCWTLFTLVMYSFPYTQPVNAGNMNYVSAVYGVVTAITLIDWFARGRRHYGQANIHERRESAISAVMERRASISPGEGDKSIGVTDTA